MSYLLLLVVFILPYLTFVESCCPGLRKSFGKREHLYKYDTNASKQCKDSVKNGKYVFMKGKCFQHANFFSQWWCTKSCLSDCNAKPGTVVSCGINCANKNKNGSDDPAIQCYCGKCKAKSKPFSEIDSVYEKECLSGVSLPSEGNESMSRSHSHVQASSSSGGCEDKIYFDRSDPEIKALLMETLQNLKSDQPLEADLAAKLKQILQLNVTMTWQPSTSKSSGYSDEFVK